jgi:hypothetical protein
MTFHPVIQGHRRLYGEWTARCVHADCKSRATVFFNDGTNGDELRAKECLRKSGWTTVAFYVCPACVAASAS